MVGLLWISTTIHPRLYFLVYNFFCPLLLQHYCHLVKRSSSYWNSGGNCWWLVVQPEDSKWSKLLEWQGQISVVFVFFG